MDFFKHKYNHTSLLRYTRFRFLILLSKILSWRSLLLEENKPIRCTSRKPPICNSSYINHAVIPRQSSISWTRWLRGTNNTGINNKSYVSFKYYTIVVPVVLQQTLPYPSTHNWFFLQGQSKNRERTRLLNFFGWILF